jgi:osmotically-inducible protein OsmY
MIDIDLATRVKIFLAAQHVPSLTKLEVEVNRDTVLLSGRVSTFYECQLAISCCKRVAGVRRIDDKLQVFRIAVVPESSHADS